MKMIFLLQPRAANNDSIFDKSPLPQWLGGNQQNATPHNALLNRAFKFEFSFHNSFVYAVSVGSINGKNLKGRECVFPCKQGIVGIAQIAGKKYRARAVTN